MRKLLLLLPTQDMSLHWRMQSHRRQPKIDLRLSDALLRMKEKACSCTFIDQVQYRSTIRYCSRIEQYQEKKQPLLFGFGVESHPDVCSSAQKRDLSRSVSM
uniref:Uncharacterized protein n=1 Tax=Lotharella globosa TaxID=91324 RepID=A0A6V3IDA6_9EUKA